MKFTQFIVVVCLVFYLILEVDGIRQIMYDTYTKQYIQNEGK